MRPILASELDDIFDDDDIVEIENNNIEYESNEVIYDCYLNVYECYDDLYKYQFDLKYDNEDEQTLLNVNYDEDTSIYIDISTIFFEDNKEPKKLKVLYNDKLLYEYNIHGWSTTVRDYDFFNFRFKRFRNNFEKHIVVSDDLFDIFVNQSENEDIVKVQLIVEY